MRGWAIILVGAASSAPTIALAQTLGRGEPVEAPLLRLVLGFALCCVLVIVAALVLKRSMRAGAPASGDLKNWLRLPTRRIDVIESQRLSPNADICLLSYDKNEYLVVVSAAGATVLRETPAPAPTPAEATL